MIRRIVSQIAVTSLVTLIVVAVILFGAAPALAASCFTDTEFHWAETYVCWLFNNGISSGYPDGSFRPENYITRAEMAVMLQQVAGAGSAGPVANADLLDGYDSSSLAPLGSQATNGAGAVSGTSFVTSVIVSLDLPYPCGTGPGIDPWNVQVIGSGYLSDLYGSSTAEIGLSRDSSVPTGGSVRSITLAPGDSEAFSTQWLYTDVSEGAHSFLLLVRKSQLGDADYVIRNSVLTVEVDGFSCP